jgi:hypothetical protein
MAAPAPKLAPVPEPCPTRTADAQIQSCKNALELKSVTFGDVATAWWGITNDRLAPDQRAAFSELYPQLKDAFGVPRGGILTSIFCCRVPVAAALTSSDRAADNPEGVLDGEGSRVGGGTGASDAASASAIHVEAAHGHPRDLRAKEILFRCQDLHNQAIEFLPSKPRKIAMRRVFGVVSELLGMLDADDGLDQSGVKCLHDELDRSDGYLRSWMQRQAQMRYLGGMVLAFFVLLTGYGVSTAIAAHAGNVAIMIDLLSLTPLAGALGAVVSVLQRMTSGRLNLSAQDRGRTLLVVGAIRPVLGAILGLVLFVFLSGRLVPITGDHLSANATTYYVLGLAFIAGFSERFAQDMLSGVQAASAKPS